MSLDIHIYVHYPPDTTVVEKLDKILEAVVTDPATIAALAERVKIADEKLKETIDEHRTG